MGIPSKQQLVGLAMQSARSQSLDASLVCAVCEQESSWNPWSIRFEPAFLARYEHDQMTTEAITRSTSWGLMQLIGETARELGFQGFLSELSDPATGLDLGCRELKRCMSATSGDLNKALLRWNGGSNLAYPGQVMARMSSYKYYIPVTHPTS